MDESDKQDDLGIRGLGLIDVSSEDDCLISSSFAFPPFSENGEHKTVTFLEPFEITNSETPFRSIEEGEQESHLHESSTPEKTGSGKYNLRKSLAWDNAFFTSEGFLEPEELSTMIEGSEKREKHELPEIQEDICRSTDSLSTLDSDTLTFKNVETDLFEDIRASIQKSSKGSIEAKSSNKKKLGVPESQTTQSIKKVDPSQDKMKPKAALKKSSVGSQGPGKAIKRVSVHPQSQQSVTTNREKTASSCKPHKVQGRITSISTMSAKRASLGANSIRLEKDNLKNTSGRGAAALKAASSGGPQNCVPRPMPPSRSLRSSATTKTELIASSSSFDSSGNGSSVCTGKVSLNSVKRKNDSGKQSPSSGSTVTSQSRIAPRSKPHPKSSELTAYLRAATKLSSNISPASSISEWSLASTSSTATVNQRPKIPRTSLDNSSSMGISVNGGAQQVSDSHNNSNDQRFVGDDIKVSSLQGECVKRDTLGTGALLCAASMKPSGLRMPSPTIGFFDGARTAVRTPNGSGQSHSGVPGASPRTRAGSFSPSAGSNKAKPGKLQSARTALVIQSTRQNASTVKPRPSLPLQEPSNTATKISSVSKNAKSLPKFQSRNSPKHHGQSLLKAAEAASKVHDISILENPHVSKNNVNPEVKAAALALGTKFSPMKENLHAFADSHSMRDTENINPSQKLIEDAQLGESFLKDDLHSFSNTNEKDEKERLHVEEQLNGLIRQVGTVEINEKVKTPSLDRILTKGN